MPRKSTTRGANGGGSIRQRADGTWEARITLGTNPGTGKPLRKSIYGKTQKEVRQKMQKALVEVDEGSYTAPSRITVKQWLETWLAEYTGDVKDSTRTSYRQHMNNHIIPALGALKLSDLTPANCQKFINDLSRREKPLSPKTVKNVHGVLHHALKQAVRLGYMRMNRPRLALCRASRRRRLNRWTRRKSNACLTCSAMMCIAMYCAWTSSRA